MCSEHETLMDTDVPAVLEVMATDHIHDCDDTTHHESFDENQANKPQHS